MRMAKTMRGSEHMTKNIGMYNAGVRAFAKKFDIPLVKASSILAQAAAKAAAREQPRQERYAPVKKQQKASGFVKWMHDTAEARAARKSENKRFSTAMRDGRLSEAQVRGFIAKKPMETRDGWVRMAQQNGYMGASKRVERAAPVQKQRKREVAYEEDVFVDAW
jgi:hypothetical protein